MRSEASPAETDDSAVAFQFKEVAGSHAKMVEMLDKAGLENWEIKSLSIRPETDSFRAVMQRSFKPQTIATTVRNNGVTTTYKEPTK